MEAWLPTTFAGVLVLAGFVVLAAKALSMMAKALTLFGLVVLVIIVWGQPTFVNGVVNDILGL